MKSGELRHSITIQQRARSKNAMSEWIDTWETFCTCWAAIEPATGNQYYWSKQIDATVDGRIRVRFMTGVKPTMRVMYEGRIFEIISIINPKESREELHLMYREKLD